MVNPNDATEVVPYLTSAATIVAIQKWLKTQAVYAKFVAAFPGADKWAHWTVAAISSLSVAMGIHAVYNWNTETGGQIIFTIPGLIVLLHGAGDFFKVFILQHTIYESTHQPPFQPPVKEPPVIPEQAPLRAGQPDPLKVNP